MRKRVFLAIFLFLVIHHVSYGQKNISSSASKAVIDSLTQRIETLKIKLESLKESRNPSLYYVKKEYDQALFSKMYEELYASEDLEKAKDIIDSRLEKSTLRKDKETIAFYNSYKNRVNRDIKMQKIHYQTLFEKEKNFKKEFFSYVKEENIEAYNKAKRMAELAIKYASENDLTNTVAYLKHYKEYIDAVIFDYHSDYDLNELTRNENDFEKEFLPLLSSDSIHHLQEAKKLVLNCYDYAANTKSLIDTNYFAKQRKAVTSAISEYYEESNNDMDLAQITDQAIKGRSDTINPVGVYKWHDKIIVIGYFVPQSSFDNVRKGEAIITADRFLAKYVSENELGKIKSGEKFGYTFLLPYADGESMKDFYYDSNKEMWQYMVCYTKVVSNYFTKEISKYMPPIRFTEDIDQMAENPDSNKGLSNVN